jgi:type II secretory pathway component PulC
MDVISFFHNNVLNQMSLQAFEAFILLVFAISYWYVSKMKDSISALEDKILRHKDELSSIFAKEADVANLRVEVKSSRDSMNAGFIGVGQRIDRLGSDILNALSQRK